MKFQIIAFIVGLIIGCVIAVNNPQETRNGLVYEYQGQIYKLVKQK